MLLSFYFLGISFPCFFFNPFNKYPLHAQYCWSTVLGTLWPYKDKLNMSTDIRKFVLLVKHVNGTQISIKDGKEQNKYRVT